MDDESHVLEIGNDERLAGCDDEQVIAWVDRYLVSCSPDDLTRLSNEVGRHRNRSDTEHCTLAAARHLSNGDDQEIIGTRWGGDLGECCHSDSTCTDDSKEPLHRKDHHSRFRRGATTALEPSRR